MIPCTECICLAMCKQRIEFECSILYNFMEDNIVYDADDRVVRGSISWKIWDEVNKQFQREDELVTFHDGNLKSARYSIIDIKEWNSREREGHNDTM